MLQQGAPTQTVRAVRQGGATPLGWFCLSPNKLYVRIWLAVVLAVAVLTLLVGWVWRLAAEPPLRDVVIRDQAGQIIGHGRSRMPRSDPGDPRSRGRGHELQAALQRYGAVLEGVPPRSGASDDSALHPQDASDPHNVGQGAGRGNAGSVAEFVVRMQNGQMMHLHLMRPQSPFWSRPPFGFAWMLIWVGIAVALATYPIVRKLTRRLEHLQHSVQQWGIGDLSIRVAESGHDEVAFLAKGFNQAAQRIQTLVQSHEALLASQKSLLANASHELRSPLARIRMGLELMDSGVAPSLKSEISRNITELDQLIEEILLASRLDAHEADMGHVESVDLIGMAAEECARVSAEFDVHESVLQRHPVASETISALSVPGIRKLLRRAVRNLLENARHHAAGEITLSLGVNADHAEIRVCDRGPGIPTELRERIFEPFYRLPGATERDGGVGLGLALVKSITLRHHGRVRCEDRPGGGVCFVVELPLHTTDTVG